MGGEGCGCYCSDMNYGEVSRDMDVMNFNLV